MTLRIAALMALAVFVVLFQLSVLARIPLPGATPDLVAATVIAVGLVRGSSAGACAGAAMGFLIDVAPPADGPLGQWTLVLAVVGASAGALSERASSKLGMLGVALGLSGACVLAAAAVHRLSGAAGLMLSELPGIILTAALYGAFLAPVVIPVVRRAQHWAVPERG